MGMFNYLIYNGICPKCGAKSEMTAEIKLGNLDLRTYRIGDKLKHSDGTNKNIDKYWNKGYVECEKCHSDFWINIQIENDILSGVSICSCIQGYIK